MKEDKGMFHTASAEEILSGRITDVYFEKTLAILRQTEPLSL